MDVLLSYQTSLSANVVLLCRYLRKNGFNLSSTEEAEALRALTLLPVDSELLFKEALSAVLCKNRHQQSRFDELYTEFWDQLERAANSKVKDIQQKKNNKSEAQKKQEQFEALKKWLNLSPASEEKEVAAYSDLEVLGKKHFNELSEEELRLMFRLIERLAKRLAHRESRLRKPAKRYRNLDIKRTIRYNMRRGGDIEKLQFSQRKQKRLKLVLLCDVSKSMDLYSRFFVHLIYAFQNAYDRIETFVFSTALHRVTEILDNNPPGEAFGIISERVPHWSGGTTIGSCLNRFSEDYGYSLLDKKTIVLILSDGWDTGHPELMRTAMRRIYKASKKVIWLNPMAGSPHFSPEVTGLKAALPYIDVMASAHNLESLRKVMRELGKRRSNAPAIKFPQD